MPSEEDLQKLIEGIGEGFGDEEFDKLLSKDVLYEPMVDLASKVLVFLFFLFFLFLFLFLFLFYFIYLFIFSFHSFSFLSLPHSHSHSHSHSLPFLFFCLFDSPPTQYQEWIEKNQEGADQEEMERAKKQLGCLEEICSVLKEKDGDASSDKVQELLEKVCVFSFFFFFFPFSFSFFFFLFFFLFVFPSLSPSSFSFLLLLPPLPPPHSSSLLLTPPSPSSSSSSSPPPPPPFPLPLPSPPFPKMEEFGAPPQGIYESCLPSLGGEGGGEGGEGGGEGGEGAGIPPEFEQMMKAMMQGGEGGEGMPEGMPKDCVIC